MAGQRPNRAHPSLLALSLAGECYVPHRVAQGHRRLTTPALGARQCTKWRLSVTITKVVELGLSCRWCPGVLCLAVKRRGRLYQKFSRSQRSMHDAPVPKLNLLQIFVTSVGSLSVCLGCIASDPIARSDMVLCLQGSMLPHRATNAITSDELSRPASSSPWAHEHVRVILDADST